MRILIVDDSATYRGIFEAHLREWGFDVVLACDGDEAFRLYQEGNGPPLALVDWEMPKMSGIELCQQIRQMASIPQPYIIVVTTKGKGSDMVHALESGANDFVPKPFDEDELRARVGVGKRTIILQNRLTDSLAELKTAMHGQQQTEEALRKAISETEILVSSIPLILVAIDQNGLIYRWNNTAEQTFNISASSVLGSIIGDLNFHLWDWTQIIQGVMACEEKKAPLLLGEITFRRPSGAEGALLISLHPLFGDSGQQLGLLLVGEDITERKRLEAQLVLAQKMESIGQLAAGIAHEINTPSQFVSDNLRFLQESFGAIQKVLDVYAQVLHTLPQDTVAPQLRQVMDTTLAEADLAYVTDEIPKALQQALDGAERVTHIVRAMKNFSHPGTAEKKPIDLNETIESTVTVARNEWKYVADLVLHLDPTLPPILCFPGEFNQVILNLIVNAAHAIGPVLEKAGGGKGTITLTTRMQEDWVEVRIADTGTGIPEGARNKIFDPFFTTKEVGKGTGQGLAMAHDVIVKKHGGRLTFETEVGTGTTFIIQLPGHLAQKGTHHDETSNLVCG
jgi:PAS domain S-box-containing protein